MANAYVRQNFETALDTDWTAPNWARKTNCLVRTGWISPDLLPDVAYYATGIDEGNSEIKANVICEAGCQIGLQILTASGGEDGYEFRLNLNGSPESVDIVKIVEGNHTVVASAAPSPGTPDKWRRLKGRMESLDYDNFDAGVKLSLFLDNEDTPVVTYTDRLQPTPRGQGFIGIRGMGAATTVQKVDNIILRRLFTVEIPKSYEMPVWTWDGLAEHALSRLERGGNAQFPKARMLEFLAFAEQELVMKCGQPWWLDRSYALSTSSMLNDMPLWIDEVIDGIDQANSRYLPVRTKAEFNLKDSGRIRTGLPEIIVFMGITDLGEMQYAIYPAPSSSAALTLNVKARPGYIGDSAQIPLVPPSHVETLIFGALRRAFQYDPNPSYVPIMRQNEQMWAEGRAAILRDKARKTNKNMTMMAPSESAKYRRKKPWWKAGPDG